ncbi:MAG: efflux RND transporter permease subunit [Bacteroidales bacterium]|nr:efflux RND transporter permease subunit [Bacteroidales bacterium]
MRLSKIAIDYYQFTLIVFAILLFAGIQAFISMPKTENPEIVIPGVSVLVVYPGANPVDMEELVALPIEEAVNELDEIKRINTTVFDGIASVSVEFDFQADADKKYEEVVQKVNSIRNKLPEEIIDLQVTQWSTSDVAMLQLALISENASYRELEYQAEILKKEVERVNGVKKVEIVACPEQEVRISLDFEKMAGMNISVDDVAGAILSNNANIPGGTMKLGDKVFSVKTSGAFGDLEQIRRTVVNSYMGRLIYLENIAEVNFDHEDIKYFVRFPEADTSGKQKTVFVIVKQIEGLNVLDIAEDAKAEIRKFASSMDKDYRLEYVFDQTIGVNNRINGFMWNLIQGIILVGLIILLALGFRSSMVVIIAIPLSILIGLSIVYAFGYGLQQISIAALVVALGLLVDNSIVMVENINRHISKGLIPRDASIAAASEIGWPVVSATLTTVLAFVPIAMMPYQAGLFIRSLPVTIIATLSISLLIALTLTPMITSKLFKGSKKAIEKEENNRFKKLLLKFIEGPYRKSLQYALRNRWQVIVISLLVFILSMYAFTFVGFSLFPKAEQPNLLIKIRLPDGTDLDKTDEIAQYVESVLDTTPEIKYYATNIGHGNPRIYYNVFPENFKTHIAEIYIETKDYDPEEFDALIARLRNTFAGYPGARISIKEFEQGSPIAAPVQIYLTGKSLDKLHEISTEIEDFLKKQDGIINLENAFTKNKTDLYFNINREKANLFGVPVHFIDQTIRTAITGTPVSKFRDKDGKEYNIVLRLPFEDKIRLEDVDKIFVKSLKGKMIPLNQLAGIEFRQSPSIITRYNSERTAEIRADVEKEYSIDDVMAPVLEKLESYPFPSGYGYHIGGEIESRSETFGGTSTAAIIAIISIFAVLVLQFRSFSQPVIIFIALPFAAIGMIWALLLSGNTFSFTAFIGFTSLVGIVVNNSIILVDYANILRSQGKSIPEALQIAGETRFTPIILTSFTTIGGLLPLTLRGGSLWAPLGWTIIGGLLVSTMLTLIMVPVFYKSFIRETKIS